MDTSQQQRRSGIPIPKNTVHLKRQLFNKLSNSNNDDLDLDAFTLLEENIALKEEKDELVGKNMETNKKNMELERDNSRMSKQLDELKKQQLLLKTQLEQIVNKFQKELQEGQTLQNIQVEQKKIINDLMIRLRQQENEHALLMEASKEAKIKLEELIPDLKNKNDQNNNRTSEKNNDTVTAETMSQLINEIGNIKTHLNSTELQLYEANEKVSELIENQHHLEIENDSLKNENANLTKVAKLMTTSMKESVDTSKKMEAALITMKKQNDELISEKDTIDSPSPKLLSTNEQVIQLKDELLQKEVKHSERIVEMTKLMENAIENNFSEKIQLLELKIDMLEKELEITIKRAEKAEYELDELRRLSKTKKISSIDGIKLTNSNNNTPIKPPPVPPPMPNFNLVANKNSSFLFDKRNNLNSNMDNNDKNNSNSYVKRQQAKNAKGMDALIAELKDGTVTLRKNRHQNKNNPALNEMFEMLEVSRKQNRNSNILVDSQFSIAATTIPDIEYV